MPAEPQPRSALTASERMRRHRSRKRAGAVLVAVNLPAGVIAQLTALGWLADNKRADRNEVARAFTEFAKHAARFSIRAPELFRSRVQSNT